MFNSLKFRKKSKSKTIKQGQTAIEYMLLLTATVAIVLVGFQKFLPKVRNSTDVFYNRVTVGIVGEAPKCGDGICSAVETSNSCCADCAEGLSGMRCPIIDNTGLQVGEFF